MRRRGGGSRDGEEGNWKEKTRKKGMWRKNRMGKEGKGGGVGEDER